jgi:hypothetical protein
MEKFSDLSEVVAEKIDDLLEFVVEVGVFEATSVRILKIKEDSF